MYNLFLSEESQSGLIGVAGGLCVKSQFLILVLVLMADVSTALGVVYTMHKSRTLAVELGTLESQLDDGLAEWSRLQIEQAWMTDASQIEQTARETLEMQQPREVRILVIKP